MDITAEDRFAIQDLYARYCQTVDRGDAAGWADTFTGRAELVTMQSVPRKLRVRHWHGLPVLTDKGDHLESVVYGMVVDISQDPPAVMAHFTYTDELVRTADGCWRMRSRASA